MGTIKTVPDGYTPGSDVATLSVVGYDPKAYYTGRAPIEAIAQGISLEPESLVFRCNLVTLADGCMEDFSGGHIKTTEAHKLIAELQDKLGNLRIKFHPGVSYRHLMTMKNAADIKAKCTPPHDIPGQPIDGYLPMGKGSDQIRELMERSQEILEDHEVNQIRRDLGENPANSIWLWGQGTLPKLPAFRQHYGLRGAGITAVDLFRGVALGVGWKLIEVEGANGYIDTNYHGKGQAAVEALDDVDIVAVHVEAPDEMGHNGDLQNKIKALELIDEHIVGPVLEKLQTFDNWRILCLPDHPTPIAKRTHTADPVPFAMAGTRIVPDESTCYTEEQGVESTLHIDPGHELMEYFLKSGQEG
jgi:2,3-bisphosphoglycerate-independent phosphoglycerate mutase